MNQREQERRNTPADSSEDALQAALRMTPITVAKTLRAMCQQSMSQRVRGCLGVSHCAGRDSISQ